MPIVTVKVFEGELTKDQTAEIIADITEAVIPYVGEAVRANTWVLVEEVKSGLLGHRRESPGAYRPTADSGERTPGTFQSRQSCSDRLPRSVRCHVPEK